MLTKPSNLPSYIPWTPYFVQETPCYPNAFRVQSRYYRMSNDPWLFFQTWKEAQEEVDRRNETHQRKTLEELEK